MDIHLGLSISPPKPEDFAYFRSLCQNEEGWVQNYDSDVSVHTREFPGTTTGCIRVRGLVRGVRAETMFECLSDDAYRDQWDTVCADSSHIYTLDARTSIGYYCLKCPFPLQNRDVVFQRFSSQVENGFIIMNHSVELPTHPPKAGIVRATSLITGYYMVDSADGCVATYLSHSDPKVALPQWLCNKISTLLAPGIFRRLFAAVREYEEWKSTHRLEGAPAEAVDEYPDAELLLAWGFPIPDSVVQRDTRENVQDLDSEDFYSADEDDANTCDNSV